MRINYFVAAVAVAFMAAAPAADAQVIQHPLSDLVAGGSSADGIAITDPLRPGYGWRFSEFTFRSTESVPVSAGDVVIRTSPADATGRGALNFVYAGELQPAEVGRSIGFLVGYRAEVVGPDPIALAGLRFSGTIPAEGAGGVAAVTKTIATLDGSDVTPETPGIDRAGMLVFNDGPGRIEDRNGDFLTTHPLRVVSVRNEFSLIPRAAGPVTLQAVNTFFTVPEPAAPFVLAAAAAAGLARRRGRGLPERRAV